MNADAPWDHVLLIGFGGPESREEVEPFIRHVAAGRNIPESRIREVCAHYEGIGGASPYNAHARRFMESLQRKAAENSFTLPFFLGMRNWHPLLEDTLSEINRSGLRRGAGVILAPHRSPASCLRYREGVDLALARQNAAIEYDYLSFWGDHPLFIEALCASLDKARKRLLERGVVNYEVIFSAHSIPVSMLQDCPYCHYAEEFRKTCEAVASRAGLECWSMAYQSRSGRAGDPWLEPSVEAVIRRASDAGREGVLIVPAGFLLDNVEVIFDLDEEAARIAAGQGMAYERAQTAGHEPALAGMLLKLLGRNSSVR